MRCLRVSQKTFSSLRSDPDIEMLDLSICFSMNMPGTWSSGSAAQAPWTWQMLNRLILNGDSVLNALVEYIERQWQ